MGDLFTTFSPLVAAAGVTISFWGVMLYVAILLVILFLLLGMARKDFRSRVFKNPVTQASEQLYLFIESMCIGSIGSHGRKYIPIIMTFWLVIFIGNAMALFLPTSPTADLSFNLGMALISIAYVQYEGIRTNGLFGHLSHFAGPKLGLALIPITGMIFVIELISELMKNVSLSLRLFGNISGGHHAVEAMNELGHHAFGLEWLNIPIGAFLIPIKLLTVVVQALVFCLLTCVYLSLVTQHHDDHGHEGHEHGSVAPAH